MKRIKAQGPRGLRVLLLLLGTLRGALSQLTMPIDTSISAQNVWNVDIGAEACGELYIDYRE
jgi:hypothetical protein